jgi:H(+)-translocating pyrophosphatase
VVVGRMEIVFNAVSEGADAFLMAEYKICCIFIFVFGIVIFFLTSFYQKLDTSDGAEVGATVTDWKWERGQYTTLAFVVGALTSLISGWIGMTVAVYSNARTAIAATKGFTSWAHLPETDVAHAPSWTHSFNTAFRAGGVMGFALTSLAMLVAFVLATVFKAKFDTDADGDEGAENLEVLFECLSGFGLGGSSIAMFGRVGGGIYTKAADVGADLAGKVVEDLPEDDPRNPATIADNVGDVAGMGSDLFGSYAEGTCAALVVASQSLQIDTTGNVVNFEWAQVLFPIVISAIGILVCIVTFFFATHLWPVTEEKGNHGVETVLKIQLLVSTTLMTIAVPFAAKVFLPEEFFVGDCKGSLGGEDLLIEANYNAALTRVNGNEFCYVGTPMKAFAAVAAGLWSGCIIGFVTEYYTSNTYTPTQEVAKSCVTGAATNIIYGLALGYLSNIIPITLLSITVYLSFQMCGMYGVALAALGMLGTLATCLSIDVYGPVCDNAGGVAEMSGLPESIRTKTDALDAAGNTTAAIGKGFAIGSAALVALALFGAFATRIGETDINILRPIVFAFIFIGAMIPYWFTALTMKSVGVAAMAMVYEVKAQFDSIPHIMQYGQEDEVKDADGNALGKPDYAKCIKISTDASLKEMIVPSLLVILTPILVGVFFGVEAVSGLLTGSISSGVQLAISQSNTGGAWDNAKKYVEGGNVRVDDKEGTLSGKPSQALDIGSDAWKRAGEEPAKYVHGKGTELHKAAVTGDTVGDPLKDTSGPAINIVMKLQAIIALVFADFFMAINNGQGLAKIHRSA